MKGINLKGMTGSAALCFPTVLAAALQTFHIPLKRQHLQIGFASSRTFRVRWFCFVPITLKQFSPFKNALFVNVN